MEDVTTLDILRHILIFALLESLKFLLAVSFYPAGFMQMDGLAASCIVLMLQTILDDLKLELAYRANNATVVELVDKQLGHTLVHQLLQTLLELLRLHRVVVFNILEQFGGERGETTEVEHIAFGECVSDLEDTIVRQTHDIAKATPPLPYSCAAP